MLPGFEMVALLKRASLDLRAGAEADAVNKINDLADVKDARRAELNALKAKGTELQAEHRDENDGGFLGLNLDESIFSPFQRNASDVAEDQQTTAVGQEKASMAISQCQKDLGEVQSSLKDIHEEYGWSQQMRDQMTEAIKASAQSMFELP
jgi:hypothetical protein